MALPFTDTFTQSTGSDQAITTYNAGWVVDTGGFSVVDATDDVVASTGGTENVAYWSTDSPNADQAVSFVISAVSTGIYPGVIARRASAGNYYTLYVDSGNYYVSRYDASVEVVLRAGTATTTAAGDVFKMEISGVGATVTIKVYRAAAASPTTFVQLGADITDSTGNRKTSAGFGGIISYSANAASRITSFTLENLAGAATQDQEGARVGADDGSESAHTWLAAQDSNATVTLGAAFLVRLLVNATGDPASAAHVLRYQKNGAGGYAAVGVGVNSAPAISYGEIGAPAYSAASGTTVAPSYPAGITTRSALILLVGQKPTTANGGTVTTPSGWTLLGSITGGNDGDTGGYTTTLGADTGNTNLLAYAKDTVTSSESGTLTVTVGGNNVAWAAIIRLQSSDDCTWAFAVGTGKDTSAGNVSIATGSMAVAAGDHLIAAMVIPTDVTTPSQFSAQALSQTGTTFGTVTEIAEPDSTAGNDIGGFIVEAPVSSGSGSGAVTLTATAGGTTTNVRGPGIVLRARVASVARELYVAPSANITAGGEATTARLTAPSGKTTADFVTGRRWDDENGNDSIDITTDDYTELEWSLNTQAPAVNGDAFQFRVYAGAAALDSYTVTPQVTLGAAATPSPPIRIPAARLAPLLHF